MRRRCRWPILRSGRIVSISQTQPYLMGVVNLSADSWYRESVALNAEAAIRRGRVLHEQGAAIIDVGAESTLAHAARVDGAAQESALVPVVRELAVGGALRFGGDLSSRACRRPA